MFDLIRAIDASALDWFNANPDIRDTVQLVSIILWFSLTLLCFVKAKAEFFPMFFGPILITAFVGMPFVSAMMHSPATASLVTIFFGGFLCFCVSICILDKKDTK